MSSPGFIAVVLLTALCSVAVQPAAAQSADVQSPVSQSARAEAPQAMSVTVLLDLSYSMRLPLSLNKHDTHGLTRIEESRRLLSRLAEAAPADEAWALLTFGGRATAQSGEAVAVRTTFDHGASAVTKEAAGLSTWGTTRLGAAITEATRYAQHAAPAGRRVLLVLSDGIDTLPELSEMPSPARLRASGVHLLFAGITLRDQPLLERRLTAWVEEAGGEYLDAARPASLAAALASLRSAPSEAPVALPTGELFSKVTPRQTAARAEPAGVEEPGGGIGGRSLPARLAVAAGLLVIPLPLILLGVRRRRRRRAIDLGRRKTRPVLRFSVERRGEHETVVLDGFPALLPGRRAGSRGREAPTIELLDEAVILTSRSPVLVNGVGRRRAALVGGERIRSRSAVWTFDGIEQVAAGPPDPPEINPMPAYLSTSLLAVGMLVVVMVFLFAPGRDEPAPVADAGKPPVVAAVQRSNRPAPPVAPAAERGSTVALVGRAAPIAPYTHTEEIVPGQQPRYFHADIMFIHAHPDDESINFGGLMALEARAGKRIVTVLFTDGTAGLDQFPNRRVGGVYPDRLLRGQALARVREQEAERALSILGSEEYVRLGLHNNPYDTIREILPLHEVLQRWGGDAAIVGRLVTLLEGFRPGIVVSPDKHHPGVFKHFEHEAVGYVTDQALRYLRAHGKEFVRGHLIAVDPMLTAEFPHSFGVNVTGVDPRSRLSYRAIQEAALREHATQRDASVIGVEVVANFADEYYAAPYWTLPTPPQSYFVPSTALPSPSLADGSTPGQEGGATSADTPGG